MEKSRTSNLGILESEFEAGELPNSCIWSYLHPYLNKYGTLTAFTCSITSKSYTYKEISEASLRWAKELLKYFRNDVPPSVAIICENNIEFPMLFLGAAAVGAPVCPITHNLNPDTVKYMLTETKPTVLIIDSAYEGTFKKEISAALGGNIKMFVRNSNCEGTKGRDELFDVLFSDSKGLDVEIAKKVDPETIAYIVFSSGTTGMPKGIMTCHRSLTNNITCYMQDEFSPVKSATESDQETFIAQFPHAHSYGMQYYFIAILTKGCHGIVGRDSMEVKQLLEMIDKFKPKSIALRAHVLAELNELDIMKQFSSVQTIMNVGSPHDPVGFKKLNAKMGNSLFLMDGYGASELGFCIITPPDQNKLGMTGKLIPGARARFVDVNTGNTICEPNVKGEMLIQSEGMMVGYLNNPQKTFEMIDVDGWFRTGDVGYYDEENFIYIIERTKDLIDGGDVKIFPTLIERIVKRHDSVIDVGVIGAPDSESGVEFPKAFVIRKGSVQEEDIIKFVEENAPSEMWLRGGVTFVEKLPRNHLGKMLRKFLREWQWSGSYSY